MLTLRCAHGFVQSNHYHSLIVILWSYYSNMNILTIDRQRISLSKNHI